MNIFMQFFAMLSDDSLLTARRYGSELIFCLLVTMCTVNSCPTCVGDLEVDTPPLFSKEYEKQYALYDDGTLEIPATQEPVNEIQS
jgi:hypothetical protein